MESPNLDRVVETFIAIPVRRDAAGIGLWQAYIHLLRSTVGPLVRQLLQEGLINWYGFLVHDRQSGVPTDEHDDGLYVHLRMELAGDSSESDLTQRLPPSCQMTQRMSVPDPPALDAVLVSTLKGGRVENGWRVLGESSEWALRMLDAHETDQVVPVENVAQFLHYIGNQLLVSAVRIPMP